MQTLEALLSFLIFLSITSSMLASFHPSPIDDSLYRMQLGEDVWQVLHLRGDFSDLADDPDSSSAAIEKDLDEMGSQTGLCIFIEGLRMTNCRGGSAHEALSSMHKSIVLGNGPEAVTLTISR